MNITIAALGTPESNVRYREPRRDFHERLKDAYAPLPGEQWKIPSQWRSIAGKINENHLWMEDFPAMELITWGELLL